MTEVRMSFVDEGYPLLCQKCGAPAGRLLSDMDGAPPEQPDPALVTVRCFQCADPETLRAYAEHLDRLAEDAPGSAS